MEDQIAGHSPAETIAGVAAPVAWRDLREWLDLVEANDLLKHIASRVEPDEELAAITLLATRREDAPALLFEQLAGDRSQARILCNMLGASKERYALAVGIDPGSFDRRHDRGDAHRHDAAHSRRSASPRAMRR